MVLDLMCRNDVTEDSLVRVYMTLWRWRRIYLFLKRNVPVLATWAGRSGRILGRRTIFTKIWAFYIATFTYHGVGIIGIMAAWNAMWHDYVTRVMEFLRIPVFTIKLVSSAWGEKAADSLLLYNYCIRDRVCAARSGGWYSYLIRWMILAS